MTEWLSTEEKKMMIVRDIRTDCSKYGREKVYGYIESGFFSKDELVDIYGLLTENAFQRIRMYPHLTCEMQSLPTDTLCPEEKIIRGDVDVLFFGVSGSGGKTCMMASLMALVGQSEEFLYREYYNNKKCHNEYGPYLAEYMRLNRIPPATGLCYIQVVNTLINSMSGWHGFSFVEFAGEQVRAIARNDREAGITDNLPPSLISILNDNNKKIIFFTIDPTLRKKCSIANGSMGESK